MSILQSFVLGVIQGITEFLPISSSGHLILLPWLFHWKDPGLAFSVWLHFGSLSAVVVYFWKDLWPIFFSGLKSIRERRVGSNLQRLQFWYLFFGTIPAVICGVLLHEYAESAFRSPALVAFVLALVGFLIYWVDGNCSQIKQFKDIRFKQAIVIGCAQALAIVPGTSRSGITMLAGRMMGLNREAAARFSFLLSVPIILGAVGFEGIKVLRSPELFPDWGTALAGYLGAFIFGWLSIYWLLGYVRTRDYAPFAWYRIVLAALIVVLSMIR